mgnify:CR=1 FL=1
MSQKPKHVFTLDEVYRLATTGGMGSRYVVFIADEYAATSRHSDSVILALNPGAAHAWVRDTDIERARAFASGAVSTQANLAAEIGQSAPDEASPSSDAKANPLAWLVAAVRNKRGSSAVPDEHKPGSQNGSRNGDKRGIAYSNVAVHGFWQVALHNKAVHLGSQLAIAPFDGSSGLFLILKDGQPLSSGMYRANMVPGSTVHISEAFVVDVSTRAIGAWRCPSEVCSTSAERLRASQRQKETKALRLVAIGAVATVSAIVVYMVSSGAAQRSLAELATLTADTDQSQSRITELRKTRFTPDKYPDGPSIVAINAVQQLYYATQDLRIDWQSIIGSQETFFQAEASRPFHQLTFTHTQNLKPDGSVNYSWPRNQVSAVQAP